MSNLLHNNPVISLKCDSTNRALPKTWAVLHGSKPYFSLGNIFLLPLQDFSFPIENLSKLVAILRARVSQLCIATLHSLSWPCLPSTQMLPWRLFSVFPALMITDSYLQHQTPKCLRAFKVRPSRAYLYPSFFICYWAIDPNSARDTSLCCSAKKISEDN